MIKQFHQPDGIASLALPNVMMRQPFALNFRVEEQSVMQQILPSQQVRHETDMTAIGSDESNARL